MTVVRHSHDIDGCSCSISKGSRGRTKGGITTTSEEEKIAVVDDKSHARNRCVSWWIIALAHCGIICGIYSTFSCEWFAWTPVDDAHAYGVFALDSMVNQAKSVGLFRYYYSSNTINHDESKQERMNTVVRSSYTCRLYVDSSQKEWILIARETDPWIFTAQFCWVIATWLAGMSTLLTFYRVCCSYWNPTDSQLPRCVACGWLLASGLQAASCLAATEICGGFDFWECPWLQGAHASAGAAWFYVLCWLLSMCGYQHTMSSSSLQQINHHHHHYYHHNNNSTSLSRSNKEEEEKHEIDMTVVTEYKVTAEELLGTDDPIIHRAVGQKAQAIREFAMARGGIDTDDDDDDRSATNSRMEEDLETATAIHSESIQWIATLTPMGNNVSGSLEP